MRHILYLVAWACRCSEACASRPSACFIPHTFPARSSTEEEGVRESIRVLGSRAFDDPRGAALAPLERAPREIHPAVRDFVVPMTCNQIYGSRWKTAQRLRGLEKSFWSGFLCWRKVGLLTSGSLLLGGFVFFRGGVGWWRLVLESLTSLSPVQSVVCRFAPGQWINLGNSPVMCASLSII